ncbi:MAG: hypothetical protein ACOCTI_02890 [Phycisphaeraceae bacterium]
MKTISFALLGLALLVLSAPTALGQADLTLLQDNRFIRSEAVAFDDPLLSRTLERVNAAEAVDFNDILDIAGSSPRGTLDFKGAARQNSTLSLDPNAMTLDGDLFTDAEVTPVVGVPQADRGRVDILSTSVADITVQTTEELVVNLTGSFSRGGGDSQVFFRGFDDIGEGATEGLSGDFDRRGVLFPGLHRIQAVSLSWGDSASLDFDLTGDVVVATPTPIAVWPGLLLMGGLILRRRRPAPDAA